MLFHIPRYLVHEYTYAKIGNNSYQCQVTTNKNEKHQKNHKKNSSEHNEQWKHLCSDVKH